MCVISQYLFDLDFLKAPVSFGANAVNLCQVYILSCVQVNATVTSASQRLTATFSPFLRENAGAPNDNFRENICSKDDLRSRIFGTFVVKFLACLSLLGFSNI